MSRLQTLVGSEVTALIEGVTGSQWERLTLVELDALGVWVRSQSITNAALTAAKLPAAKKTPIVFAPYSAIRVMDWLDEFSLAEKAFDVGPESPHS